MNGWYVAAYIVFVVSLGAFCIWLDWRQWRAERAQERWNRLHRPYITDSHRIDPSDPASSVRVLRRAR